VSTLNARQQEILSYIIADKRAKGYPPTLREIADAVGLSSVSCVLAHLYKLEEMGYIRREPSTPRGLTVLREA